MKKLLWVGLLSTVLAPIFAKMPYVVYPSTAEAKVASNSWQSYFGIGAGFNHFGFDKALSAQTPLGFRRFADRQTKVSGADFAAFIGITKRWQQFDLAAELSYDHAFGSKTLSVQPAPPTPLYSVKESMSDTVGLSLLPGYYFDNQLHVFTRFGAVLSNFRSKSSVNGGGDIGYTGSLSKWRWGAQVGVGADYPVWMIGSKPLSLRLEYDYTRYPHFNETSNNAFFGDVTVKYHYLHNQSILLSLVYPF